MRTRVSVHAGPISVSGGGCGVPLLLAVAVLAGVAAIVANIVGLIR